MNDKRYNVLWFEDNPKVSFINLAYLSGIDITVGKNKDEGLEILRMNTAKFDALILDANYKRANETESLILAELINDITEISRNKKPWFVLTAVDYQGIEAISYIIPESIWENEFGTKRFYNKVGAEEQKLFADIKRVVGCMNSTEWQIRNEYPDVFEVCSDKYIGGQNAGRLLNLLIAMKNKDNKNPIHFNSIRKVTEDFFEKLHQLGLLPREQEKNGKVEKMSINGKSIFLSNSNKVPIYVQRSIHSIISITQDASHSTINTEVGFKSNNLQVDYDLQSNKAPYLLCSTGYELLTILIWIKSFIDNNSNLENIRTKIDISPKKIIDISKIEDSKSVEKNEITSSLIELEPIITKETLMGIITSKLPSAAFFAPDDKSDSIQIQGKLVSSLKEGMKVSVLVITEKNNNKLTRSVSEIINLD